MSRHCLFLLLKIALYSGLAFGRNVGQEAAIAPKNDARGIADRPFLMLMGRTDKSCHPQHAQQLLDLIPSASKELIHFDAGTSCRLDTLPRRSDVEKNI